VYAPRSWVTPHDAITAFSRLILPSLGSLCSGRRHHAAFNAQWTTSPEGQPNLVISVVSNVEAAHQDKTAAGQVGRGNFPLPTLAQWLDAGHPASDRASSRHAPQWQSPSGPAVPVAPARTDRSPGPGRTRRTDAALADHESAPTSSPPFSQGGKSVARCRRAICRSPGLSEAAPHTRRSTLPSAGRTPQTTGRP